MVEVQIEYFVDVKSCHCFENIKETELTKMEHNQNAEKKKKKLKTSFVYLFIFSILR